MFYFFFIYRRFLITILLLRRIHDLNENLCLRGHLILAFTEQQETNSLINSIII